MAATQFKASYVDKTRSSRKETASSWTWVKQNFLLEKFFLKTPPANFSFFYWPELGFMLTPKIIDREGKFLIDSGFTFWLDRGICFLEEQLEVCGWGEVLLKRNKRYFGVIFGGVWGKANNTVCNIRLPEAIRKFPPFKFSCFKDFSSIFHTPYFPKSAIYASCLHCILSQLCCLHRMFSLVSSHWDFQARSFRMFKSANYYYLLIIVTY